jgi:hypothetical protein
VCTCSGRELQIIYLPVNQKKRKIGLDMILGGEMGREGVCFIDCTVK